MSGLLEIVKITMFHCFSQMLVKLCGFFIDNIHERGTSGIFGLLHSSDFMAKNLSLNLFPELPSKLKT